MTATGIKRFVMAAVIAFAGASAGLAQDLRGMEIFAPADPSPYGRGPQAAQGYFFCIDGLYWSYSIPHTAKIGDPTPIRVDTGARLTTDFDPLNPSINDIQFDGRTQFSTLDNSDIRAVFSGGQRVEFGHVVDHWGWYFSTYRLDDVTQQFTYQAADINFRDPQGLIQGPIAEFNFPNEGLNFEVDGRFPMNFSSVTMYNKIGTWNVELNALYRTYPSHWGGQCEFTFGPRYMEINEDFSASAVGGFTTLAGDTSAGTSWWTMRTENHIVGPQVGLRWFRKFSRFTTSLETKFMAGLNQQNFKLRYNLAPGLSSVSGTAGYPATYAGSAGATAQYVTEFAPVVELRADVRYQLTRNFSLRAGWNGIWMDGVARASNSIIYQVPNMGINSANNRQNMLIHGLTVGVDINR